MLLGGVLWLPEAPKALLYDCVIGDFQEMAKGQPPTRAAADESLSLRMAAARCVSTQCGGSYARAPNHLMSATLDENLAAESPRYLSARMVPMRSRRSELFVDAAVPRPKVRDRTKETVFVYRFPTLRNPHIPAGQRNSKQWGFCMGGASPLRRRSGFSGSRCNDFQKNLEVLGTGDRRVGLGL
jgi:hypothetical protein